MLELAEAQLKGGDLSNISGICVKTNHESILQTAPRPPVRDLDSLAFPVRDLFDNAAYQEYFRNRFGRLETSIITTLGAPLIVTSAVDRSSQTNSG